MRSSGSGVDSMPETAENVAEEFNINRQDQDAFALSSQLKAERAQNSGVFDDEITPVFLQLPRQATSLAHVEKLNLHHGHS